MAPVTVPEQDDRERRAHQPFDAQSDCEICSKILLYASQANKPFEGPTLGIAEDVLRSQCSHMALFQDWLHNRLKLNPSCSKSLLTVAQWPMNDKLLCFQLEITPGDAGSHHMSGPIGLLRKLTVPDHPGPIRAVDTQWIDVGLLKQWIATCDAAHGDRCRQSSWLKHLEAVRPKYLVDTTEMCIVEGERIESEYIALSYQWGQTKTLRNTTEVRERLLKPSSLSDWDLARYIPRTVSDAFAIVKLLGYRYIWVDALCVTQNDHAELATELRRMHLIYTSASFTIVAADGSDANYGLRGLKGLTTARHHSQAHIQLSGSERMATSHPSLRYLKSLVRGAYHTRAWTFQEFEFSLRRLIFQMDAVFWHCEHGKMYEDMIEKEPDQGGPSSRLVTPLSTIPRQLAIVMPTLDALAFLVSAFNQRRLSFQEDALSAFIGIQGLLERFYQSGFLYGLPEFWFELSLCWIPAGVLKRRVGSSSRSSTGTSYQLPSWSWIGWAGTIHFPRHETPERIGLFGDSFTEPVTTWHTLAHATAPGQRPIATGWHRYRSDVSEGRLTTLPEGWSQQADSKQGTVFSHCRSPYDEHLYPFPVPEPSSSSVSVSVPQTAYLSAQTSRAFLCGKRKDTKKYLDRESYPLWLTTSQGRHVGYLHLNSAKEQSLFKRSKYPSTNLLELVAISKGNTVSLLPLDLNWDVEIERLYKTGEIDQLVPRPLIDCIYVLWIEWEDGIAYRRACGAVVAEAWEQEREPELVDLILG